MDDQLVELFPHDPEWAQSFAKEAATLRAIFGVAAKTIHHVGSTAIPTIRAKPVVDITVESSIFPPRCPKSFRKRTFAASQQDDRFRPTPDLLSPVDHEIACL